jgi:hypothetical protein
LKKGKNIRDFATTEELLVIANCESANAIMIREGKNKEERLNKLIFRAKEELQILNRNKKLTKDNTLFKQIETNPGFAQLCLLFITPLSRSLHHSHVFLDVLQELDCLRIGYVRNIYLCLQIFFFIYP